MAKTAAQTAKEKAEKAKKAFDFIDAEDTMEGFEDINSQTMAVPFLKIAQDLTPQAKKKNAAYIEGLEVGEFFNTVSKDNYGDSIDLIVLKFERMYIEWLPERGGFVGYHTPENAQRIAVDQTFGKWKTAEGNELTETYVYFVLVADEIDDGIMIFSCTSSAIKTAKEWNRLMTTHVLDNGQRAMPYHLVWTLTTEERVKDTNSWMGFRVAFKEVISKDQYLVVKPERKALPDRRVDYSQIGDTSSASSDEDFDEATDF